MNLQACFKFLAGKSRARDTQQATREIDTMGLTPQQHMQPFNRNIIRFERLPWIRKSPPLFGDMFA